MDVGGGGVVVTGGCEGCISGGCKIGWPWCSAGGLILWFRVHGCPGGYTIMTRTSVAPAPRVMTPVLPQYQG